MFIVLFEDNEAADPSIRQTLMSQHVAYLTRQPCDVHGAGPLLDGHGAICGGLWLVNAETEQEVKALVEGDPFWPTGLRKSYKILQWRRVVAENSPRV